MIPYGRQDISDEDIQAVVDVLRSDFLTQGPAVPKFETSVANSCGVQHAVAVNSATSALHIACLALGLGKGDVAWTTPITFVASANCILYCGAAIDFVDIDPRTYNMSVDCLAKKLEQAAKNGTLPKVVIPVHLCGQSCDMAEIHDLSLRYGFRIIEDASHAIGGQYKGEPIGNCRYSEIAIFSFHPVKIITTAEGGMALTNDAELAKKMSLFRSHGITRNIEDMSKEPDGPWYYEQIELGFNYRMTDLQAALGLSQMKNLSQFVLQRHEIARLYDELLSGLPIVLPLQHADSFSAFHLYVIRIESGKTQQNHLQIFEYLREHGIGVNLHYIPVHTQPYYINMGFKAEDFPQASRYYSEAITLPMYPGLTKSQQNQVVSVLTEVVSL